MICFTGIREIDRLLADAEETGDGSGVRRREIFHSASRYLFDSNILGEWEQFDTTSDAWYFGIWVNKTERWILSYIEGDVRITVCDSPESYDAEISEMCSFYPPSPEAVAIDVYTGARTAFFQGRLQFFIDPSRATVPDIPKAHSGALARGGGEMIRNANTQTRFGHADNRLSLVVSALYRIDEQEYFDAEEMEAVGAPSECWDLVTLSLERDRREALTRHGFTVTELEGALAQRVSGRWLHFHGPRLPESPEEE